MKEKSITEPGLLAADCIIMFLQGIIILLLGPMVPELMRTFDVGESAIGFLISAGSLGYAIGSILGGILLDRRGLKLVLVLGFSLETAFLIFFGFTPLFGLTVVFNFGLLFMGGHVSTAGNYIPTKVGAKSVSSIMNLTHFFFSCGAFIGPLLIGIFLNNGGRWQSVFYITGIPTFLLSVFFLFIKFNPPHIGEKRKDVLAETGTPGKSKFNGSLTSLEPAKHPAVIFGAVTLMLYMGAEYGFSLWIVNYLEKGLAFSKIHASLGLALMSIGLMAGRLVNVALARTVSSRLLMLTAAGLGVLFGTVFFFVSQLVTILTVIFFLGFAMSGILPNTLAEINRRFPKNVGIVTGVMAFGSGAGATLFQWLIGMTAEHVGLKASMMFTPVLTGLSGVTFFIAVYYLRKRSITLN